MKSETFNPLRTGKKIIFPMLLLFWLFCLPLAFSIYAPYSYQANCHWNERCAVMGVAKTQRSITELTDFFLHRTAALPHPWTAKETIHMLEVRAIYDKVFMAFALTTLLFIIDLWFVPDAKQRYSRYARNSLLLSIGLALLALLMIPFFRLFWLHVFHPLFFDNEL